ncbi:hypothetical protein SLS55_004639 [Diplodia seriata]|uniref:Uncharacterized protein n=1 Tax=Diplodia seriata TaxID=420778 RepID=A0ABR3CK02_9PEZI
MSRYLILSIDVGTSVQQDSGNTDMAKSMVQRGTILRAPGVAIGASPELTHKMEQGCQRLRIPSVDVGTSVQQIPANTNMTKSGEKWRPISCIPAVYVGTSFYQILANIKVPR